MTPSQQLEAIRAEFESLMAAANAAAGRFLAELRQHGIFVMDYGDLNDSQRLYAKRFLTITIYPVLTPLQWIRRGRSAHLQSLAQPRRY